MKQVRKAMLSSDLVQLPRSLKRADLGVEGYVVAVGTPMGGAGNDNGRAPGRLERCEAR